MKKVFLAGFALSVLALSGVAPAHAEGGCGPFAHRGWDGSCHRNDGPGLGYGFTGGYGYRNPENPYHRQARLEYMHDRREIVAQQHAQRWRYRHWEHEQRDGY